MRSMRVGGDAKMKPGSILKNRDYNKPRIVEEAPDAPRHRPAKKDTKRWCGGKVGREHRKEWVRSGLDQLTKRPDNESWWDLICATCKKKFDYCWMGFTRGLAGCKCGYHRD